MILFEIQKIEYLHLGHPQVEGFLNENRENNIRFLASFWNRLIKWSDSGTSIIQYRLDTRNWD